MKYYNCKVRLKGNVAHEVSKFSLSAPEVIILKHLHGDDGVLNIEETDVLPDYRFERIANEEAKKNEPKYERELLEFDSTEERTRLAMAYDEGLMALEGEQKTSVAKLFGASYSDIMEALPRGVAHTPLKEEKRSVSKPVAGKAKARQKEEAPEGAVI